MSSVQFSRVDKAEGDNYRVPILWDWKERSGISRTASAIVEVKFGHRAE